ncbi:hypothetical protein BH23CHL2_BH23CHL2_24660 [soil metagenome]
MSWKSTINVLMALTVIAVLLAACGDEDVPATATLGGGGSAPTATKEPHPTATEAPDQPDLDGTVWLLSAIGGADIDLQEPITLEFSDGQAGGYSGCNTYGGGYSASESGEFTLSEVSQTDMACEAGMDLESDYLSALQLAARYEVIGGQRLELANVNGETLLVFTIDSRDALDFTLG